MYLPCLPCLSSPGRPSSPGKVQVQARQTYIRVHNPRPRSLSPNHKIPSTITNSKRNFNKVSSLNNYKSSITSSSTNRNGSSSRDNLVISGPMDPVLLASATPFKSPRHISLFEQSQLRSRNSNFSHKKLRESQSFDDNDYRSMKSINDKISISNNNNNNFKAHKMPALNPSIADVKNPTLNQTIVPNFAKPHLPNLINSPPHNNFLNKPGVRSFQLPSRPPNSKIPYNLPSHKFNNTIKSPNSLPVRRFSPPVRSNEIYRNGRLQWGARPRFPTLNPPPFPTPVLRFPTPDPSPITRLLSTKPLSLSSDPLSLEEDIDPLLDLSHDDHFSYSPPTSPTLVTPSCSPLYRPADDPIVAASTNIWQGILSL